MENTDVITIQIKLLNPKGGALKRFKSALAS